MPVIPVVPFTSNLIAFVASVTSIIVVVLSDNFLFVNVCEPEFVVTVESISIVRVPEPSTYVASIPVPPTTNAPTISCTVSVSPEAGIQFEPFQK